MFSLKNKVALITGAASGIGAAIAETFAGAGATVWVADRDATNGATVAQKIGGEFVEFDVTDEAACAALPGRVGPLDILVNNAGIGHVGTMLTTTGADLDRLYAVNVRGVFNVTRVFLPDMLARHRGNIINLGSIGGVLGVRDRLAYSITKFAVVGLTKSMALDHARDGIRVNCICPGRVETPFLAARIAEYPDPALARRELGATHAIGRLGKPEEVAAAALYLASDESAFVTGTNFMIDGGWTTGK